MPGAAFVAQLVRCRVGNCLYFDKLIGVTENRDAKQGVIREGKRQVPTG